MTLTGWRPSPRTTGRLLFGLAAALVPLAIVVALGLVHPGVFVVMLGITALVFIADCLVIRQRRPLYLEVTGDEEVAE